MGKINQYVSLRWRHHTCVWLFRLQSEYEEHSREALKDPEGHLSNPLNAYYLIKKFTTDWELHTTKIIDDDKVEGNIR